VILQRQRTNAFAHNHRLADGRTGTEKVATIDFVALRHAFGEVMRRVEGIWETAGRWDKRRGKPPYRSTPKTTRGRRATTRRRDAIPMRAPTCWLLFIGSEKSSQGQTGRGRFRRSISVNVGPGAPAREGEGDISGTRAFVSLDLSATTSCEAVVSSLSRNTRNSPAETAGRRARRGGDARNHENRSPVSRAQRLNKNAHS
jgi:hypothetical protein